MGTHTHTHTHTHAHTLTRAPTHHTTPTLGMRQQLLATYIHGWHTRTHTLTHIHAYPPTHTNIAQKITESGATKQCSSIRLFEKKPAEGRFSITSLHTATEQRSNTMRQIQITHIHTHASTDTHTHGWSDSVQRAAAEGAI